MVFLKEKYKMNNIIKSSVIMIQKNWREFTRRQKSRTVFQDCLKKMKAVLKIQKSWRVYFSDKNRKLNAAATHI